ncbi:HAMP domain-containing sensor histidine kinase [Kitasatospora sp. NPDC028055]|uniref:HAMP domain-containing sensor histidine kinase n=1 Tax=Kitasatospora sp. NPDC028055 TaxID=3155653 RepID=UPI0033E63EC2
MTLRVRLAVATALAVATVALGLSWAAFAVIRYELTHQLELELTQAATVALQQQGNEPPGVLSGQCRYLAAPACTQIVPADPARAPRTAVAPYLFPVTPAVREVAAGQRAAYFSTATVAGFPARMLVTPFRGGTALQVVLRSDGVDRAVRQSAAAFAGLGAAGVLAAGFLGWWVSRTGLRPVARLTATVERITATGDPHHRITSHAATGRRRDEVSRLGESFDTMLDALERSVTAQRRLVSDASHELRTPLTALRTNAELLARGDRLTDAQRERAATALGRQLREVTGMVNDLVELARDEEPQALVERFRLLPLVEHAVTSARGHWPGQEFTLSVGPGAAEAVVPGVPARLVRLLGNLLDNAAKFGAGRGPVEVRVALAGDGGDTLEVSVRDHGPGIATEDLPYVFDRFYRSDTARSLPGSGLGLAMARQIARAHGADLVARETDPHHGGGACFALTGLPVDS